jgi:hypothetical protein
MKFTVTTVKRLVTSAVALGALASATALTASPASAATSAGQLEVCSLGNYSSYVQFPARGELATTFVRSNTCQVFGGLGASTTVEPITVRGKYNTSSNTFWVANGDFRPSEGGQVNTYGTTKAGDHWALTPRV